MKSKANKLIIGIIFLAGLSLLLYPFVANQWNNYRQKQLISSYEQTVSEKDAAHEIDYDAELQKLTTKHYFQVSFLTHLQLPQPVTKKTSPTWML